MGSRGMGRIVRKSGTKKNSWSQKFLFRGKQIKAGKTFHYFRWIFQFNNFNFTHLSCARSMLFCRVEHSTVFFLHFCFALRFDSSWSNWRRGNCMLISKLFAFFLIFLHSLFLWWQSSWCIALFINFPFIAKAPCGVDHHTHTQLCEWSKLNHLCLMFDKFCFCGNC